MKVLDVLKKEKMFLKMTKCEFGKTPLVYLGHIVEGDELKIDPSRIKVIVDWSKPNNVTEVRGFLGEAQYWRNFIPKFSSISAPLHALRSVKQVFLCQRKQHKAFHALNKRINTC